MFCYHHMFKLFTPRLRLVKLNFSPHRSNLHPTPSPARASSTATTMSGKPTLSSLSAQLLPTTRLAQPPHHSTFPALTATISDAQFHPTIEAALHIANSDLPSAHFLVRHMQAPPAVEGMLLHGILHRAEGDFDNARAWIGDVGDACEGFVPKKKQEGERLDEGVFERVKGVKEEEKSLVEYVYGDTEPGKLIDDVEAFRSKKAGGSEEEIEERIRGELGRVLEWCKGKFGDGEWKDASSAWVKNSEEIQAMSNEMTSGDKGFRKF
jgi:hypothetical protein